MSEHISDLEECWDEVGEGEGRQLGQRGEGGRHDGGGGQQQQGHGGGGLQLGGDKCMLSVLSV